jgi:flagellar biosynthetic protein FliO
MNRNHRIAGLLAAILIVAGVAVVYGNKSDTSAVITQNQPVAESGEQQEAIPSLTESVLPSLTRIALTLCVVVAIIYLTVFLLKKLSGNRAGGTGRGKTVQVIEQTYLAPKKSVCLLKLADRAVLVGITDTSINLLTEFDWETLPSDIVERAGRSQAGFQGILNEAAGRLFGGRKDKGVGHGPTA